MPHEKSVSFRTHLQSNVHDLLTTLGLNCTHTIRLVVGLVSKLAAYTEEGTPMAPTVFICNSVSELIQRAGAGQHILLAQDQPTESVAPKILKLAAPLCSDQWKIFIERLDGGQTCNFGVFCGSNDPASLSVEEVVLNDEDPGFPIVCIAQTVTNSVGVATSDGHGIEFRFNDDVDATLTNQGDTGVLAKAMCRSLEAEVSAFQGLLKRVVGEAIRSSHGTLVAVTSDVADGVPDFLSDATVLDPPLDLYAMFNEHIEAGRTASSLGNLLAACEVLGGFIRSDGITVFGSDGKVLAYRAFVKSEGDDNPVAGGARTRAFGALSAKVGHSLCASFFRSQDGKTELVVLDEGQIQ